MQLTDELVVNYVRIFSNCGELRAMPLCMRSRLINFVNVPQPP